LVVISSALCILAHSAAALADVDLLFDPVTQTVVVGDTVEINLVARSNDGTPQLIVGIDAIIAWDPAALELLGADSSSAGVDWFVSGFLNDPDGINDGIDEPPFGVPFNDGDALFTAMAPPGSPGIAGPDDLVVTTLLFQALVPTAGTTISLLPELGTYGLTRVLSVDYQEITGDISGTATVEITCPPLDGDMNGDGVTNGLDIQPLLDAVLAGSTNPTLLCHGDFDGSGVMDIGDVDGMVAVLLD
jgi:hypothetical protein